MKDFLKNRDETGRETHTFLETGKKFYIEYIGIPHVQWGDINPATKKVSVVKAKGNGSVLAEDSLLTAENGFTDAKIRPGGSTEWTLHKLHEQWKIDSGWNDRNGK
jgi:hypothetical protein